MKKWAIRGLMTLGVVVALCMFFSGTVKNLTTAKVKIAVPKGGRLEEKIELKGDLTFPRTHEVKPPLESGESLVVTRVAVANGYRVSKGDPLLETEVADYEKTRDELNEAYQAAQKAYLELERKNSGLYLRRSEENWIAAYDALAQCGQDLMQARLELRVIAEGLGLSLVDDRLSEGAEDAALLEAQRRVEEAVKAQQEAQRQFDDVNRLGIQDKVVEYITQNRELTARMQKAQDGLLRLETLRRQTAVLTAPHDGYVVSVPVKAGDVYNGKTALLLMSAQGQEPVLRADVDDLERVIEKETKVEITREGGKALEKRVTETGMNAMGREIIDVALKDTDVTALGGCASLLDKQVDLSITYKAAASTTLLPSAAVRGVGSSRYVYLISEEWSKTGRTVLRVQKLPVTVLAEFGDTASVENELGNSRVAYMEDRAISEGSEVMAYGQ